jgi:hypothetical protein
MEVGMSVINGPSGRPERFNLRNEVAVIPAWSIAIAAAAFICIPVLFLTVVWRHEPAPAIPFRFLISLLPATVVASLALLVGYVNADAGRRGMNRILWTILVIFVPNAIGFILYFLLRNPIRSHCPRCATEVDLHVNYCPACGYGFHPTCSHCKASLRATDSYCPQCGTAVKAQT